MQNTWLEIIVHHIIRLIGRSLKVYRQLATRWREPGFETRHVVQVRTKYHKSQGVPMGLRSFRPRCWDRQTDRTHNSYA